MAVPLTVDFEVRSISGDVLTVDVDPGKKVSNLKERIAEHWHIPPACQKLIAGVAVLDDRDDIKSHCCHDAGGISVTLVVSLEDITRDLNSEERSRQSLGLTRLKELGARGGQATLTAWGMLLDHRRATMRRNALLELAGLARKGDANVCDQMALRLGDSSAAVRLAAVRAIKQVVEKGNERVVEALIACLHDSHQYAGVRLAAIQSVAVVAEKGDRAALTAVLEALGDEDEDVRRTALKAAVDLCECGDMDVVLAVCAMLRDVDADVRCTAVDALAELAGAAVQITDCVRDALAAHHNDPDPNVQSLIVKTLAQMERRR